MSAPPANPVIGVGKVPKQEFLTYNGSPLYAAFASFLEADGERSQFYQIVNDTLNHIDSLHNPKRRLRAGDMLFQAIFASYQAKLDLGNATHLREFWYRVLGFVALWEDKHISVHKGTAFFWLGLAHLTCGDVPSAYFSFFNAIEEDKRNYPPAGIPLGESPVYLTLTLSPSPNNALQKMVVLQLREWLMDLIAKYQTRYASNFKIEDLDTKFLSDPKYVDIRTRFVATFHELYNLRRLISSRLIRNDFATLELGDSLFTLSLVVDQLLEDKFLWHSRLAYNPKKTSEKDMAKALYALAVRNRIISRKVARDAGAFIGLMDPKKRKRTFRKSVLMLLSGLGTINAVPMTDGFTSLYLAYTIRNNKAHDIKSEKIYIEKYDQIFTRVMDAFFLAVEMQ